MPTSNDKAARLRTDLHDLTEAMERVYQKMTKLQAKKSLELRTLEERFNRDIEKEQREYDAMSRRLVLLRTNIRYEEEMARRELSKSVANDNRRPAANDNRRPAANDNGVLKAGKRTFG